jgi:hypothetical protein
MDDTGMKRQSGLALSILIVSLWMGQTALTESGPLPVGLGCRMHHADLLEWYNPLWSL